MKSGRTIADMYQRILNLRETIKHKSVFLFGPRQTGKSTLVHQTFPKERPDPGPDAGSGGEGRRGLPGGLQRVLREAQTGSRGLCAVGDGALIEMLNDSTPNQKTPDPFSFPARASVSLGSGICRG